MPKIIHKSKPDEFNTKLAEELKKLPEFQIPEWSLYVKSGSTKQRTPEDKDFWYKRAASILRQLYINGVVGVNKLKTRYGSKKNRGSRPTKFRKASGKIIRVILQQAEDANLVEKIDKTQYGRRLTQNGRNFLDSIIKDMKAEEINKGKEENEATQEKEQETAS